MTRIKILDIGVDTIAFDKALAIIKGYLNEPKFHLVTTVNAEFILTASDDADFKNILNSSDLSLPDGAGVVWALCHSRRRDLESRNPISLGGSVSTPASEAADGVSPPPPSLQFGRIAGADLVPALIKIAAENGFTVGLLGGEDFQGQNVCDLTSQNLRKQYPNLRIVYCSREPSAEVFTTPIDLLLVAFGHPKQEKWLWRNRERLLNVKVAMGVGGTFDFIIGKKQRAPEFIRRIGVEGLWRLIIEPARWRRVFKAYVIFPFRVIKAQIVP